MYAATYIEWFAEEATRANGDVIPASVPGRRMLALREAGIPASALWSEDWRGGVAVGADQYRLDEDWRLDRDQYPDFEVLLSEMGDLGFVSQVYSNTFLTEGGDVFDEAIAAHREGRKPRFTGR